MSAREEEWVGAVRRALGRGPCAPRTGLRGTHGAHFLVLPLEALNDGLFELLCRGSAVQLPPGGLRLDLGQQAIQLRAAPSDLCPPVPIKHAKKAVVGLPLHGHLHRVRVLRA